MTAILKHNDKFLEAYKARVDFTNHYRPNCAFGDYIYHVDEKHALKWIEEVKKNNPNISDFTITLYQ